MRSLSSGPNPMGHVKQTPVWTYFWPSRDLRCAVTLATSCLRLGRRLSTVGRHHSNLQSPIRRVLQHQQAPRPLKRPGSLAVEHASAMSRLEVANSRAMVIQYAYPSTTAKSRDYDPAVRDTSTRRNGTGPSRLFASSLKPGDNETSNLLARTILRGSSRLEIHPIQGSWGGRISISMSRVSSCFMTASMLHTMGHLIGESGTAKFALGTDFGVHRGPFPPMAVLKCRCRICSKQFQRSTCGRRRAASQRRKEKVGLS